MLILQTLDAFLAVVKHKTVHAAAAALHITQTAVTHRIQKLEIRLKTCLFIRSRRGMQLTQEGEALLRYCLAVRELEGETLSKINKIGVENFITIRLIGPTSLMHSRVIPQCLAVLKNYPKLLFHFDINDLENRDLLLRTGEAQLVIIREEQVAKEMDSKKLQSEKFILVCTAKWRGRRLQDILQTERIVDYDPRDTATFDYLKAHHLFHLAQRERHFVNRADSLARMLIAGCGYSVLTQEFAKPHLQTGQLIALNAGKIYENNYYLAWYPRSEMPKYFSSLIKAIN